MFRRLLTFALACLVALPLSAVPLSPQAALGAAEVRDRIRALPPGTSLEVQLTSGEKLKGKLGSITQDGFELRQAKNNARVIPFVGVTSVHSKHGMSTGAKVGLGLGIFAGVAILVTALVFAAIGRNG